MTLGLLDRVVTHDIVHLQPDGEGALEEVVAVQLNHPLTRLGHLQRLIRKLQVCRRKSEVVNARCESVVLPLF